MSNLSGEEYFKNVESVISDDLKFKAYLGIGENAYASLKLTNSVKEIWDTLGVASTGAAIASSSTIATTFFAHNAVFAALGLASTPVGWVVAAGFLSGGAWLGITRYFKKFNKERLTVIPQFINTPIDILGLTLFDLIAPLALKIANVDGHIDNREIDTIKNYFVEQWGYDQFFVEDAVLYLIENIDECSIRAAAMVLAEYKHNNPDCDYDSMSQEILRFLQNIIVADGKVDDREIMALRSVKRAFEEVAELKINKTLKKGLSMTTRKIRKEMINVRKNMRNIFDE